MADLKQNCFFLLDSLVKGNPRYTASIYRALIALLPADSSTAVQVSLQILRKIQPSVDPIKELISPLLGTLGSYHGEVRYEAKLFIIALADNQIISDQLLHGLVKSLDLNLETQNLSDYIRQSAAVESLDELIRMKPSEWIENKLIQHGVLSKLIHTLANTKHPESQRNAAVALMVRKISPIDAPHFIMLLDTIKKDSSQDINNKRGFGSFGNRLVKKSRKCSREN